MLLFIRLHSTQLIERNRFWLIRYRMYLLFLFLVKEKILTYYFLSWTIYCEQFDDFHEHFTLQLNQTPQVPAGLRALKNTNPRVSHFGIDANTSIAVGRRIFCSATWNELNVTLCIAFDLATHVSRKEFYLAPIIEFIDSPPKEIIDNARLPTNKQLEGTSSISLYKH